MFGWLKKKRKPSPTINNFGRYLLKPVTERAVMHVTGLDYQTFIYLVATKQLKLNGTELWADRLSDRLESGNYEIEQTNTATKWRFFIA